MSCCTVTIPCTSRAAILKSTCVGKAEMQRNSRLTADALLHLLLDRYEAPRARVRDITQPIDYTQIGGPAEQDEFHRILHDAERAGSIALEKERLGRFTGEYARVRLTNAASLYTFLVRS